MIFDWLRRKSESPSRFEDLPEARAILAAARPAVLLRPQRAAEPLPPTASKFGGAPNTAGLAEWPRCEDCDGPLNFVLQLYRRDFPEFFWPEGKDRFLLFRCADHDCPGAYAGDSDLPLRWFFLSSAEAGPRPLDRPAHEVEDAEPPAQECRLEPSRCEDRPEHGDDQDESAATAWASLSQRLPKSDWIRTIDEYARQYALRGTKIGGFPSWTQSPNYPACTCGRKKEFLFQLADDGAEGAEGETHGIGIGDTGNIYFFVCRNCGEKSIETNWDCA